MSRKISLAELLRFLRQAAGESEQLDPEGDILDTEFTELGYDSIALMETCAVMEREYGTTIDDTELADARTPRAMLALVNQRLVNTR